MKLKKLKLFEEFKSDKSDKKVEPVKNFESGKGFLFKDPSKKTISVFSETVKGKHFGYIEFKIGSNIRKYEEEVLEIMNIIKNSNFDQYLKSFPGSRFNRTISEVIHFSPNMDLLVDYGTTKRVNWGPNYNSEVNIVKLFEPILIKDNSETIEGYQNYAKDIKSNDEKPRLTILSCLNTLYKLINDEEHSSNIHISNYVDIDNIRELIDETEDDKLKQFFEKLLQLIDREINGEDIQISSIFSSEKLRLMMKKYVLSLNENIISNMNAEDLKIMSEYDLIYRKRKIIIFKLLELGYYNKFRPADVLAFNRNDINELKPYLDRFNNFQKRAINARCEELRIPSIV